MIIKKHLPFLYFLILSFLVLGPLFLPGSFFLLDYIPHNIQQINLISRLQEGDIINNLPFVFLLFVLNKIISFEILEKILFFLPLFFSGYFIYLTFPQKLGIIPRLIAGTFYMINPFTYERFMAGHLPVLFAYSFLPLCFHYFLKIFSNSSTAQPARLGRITNYQLLIANYCQTNKNIILAASFWTLTIIFSLHFLFITGILFFIIFLVNLISNKNYKQSLKTFLKTLLFLLFFNSFWLFPLFFSSSSNNILTNADLTHFNAFRTASDKTYGLLLNILGMYGFWRERTMGKEIILTKNLLPFWPVFYAFFLIPIFLGAIKLIKEKQNKLLFILIIIATVAVFLNIGPAENFIGIINKWLFLHIPGFKGMREMEKINSLLVLTYTILIAWGIYYLKTLRNDFIACLPVRPCLAGRRAEGGPARQVSLFHCFIVYFFISLIFINIFLYNYQFFWAGGGQIKTIPYPLSYKQTQEILKTDKSNSKILLLPWQMYMKYLPGGGRTTADPLCFLPPHKIVATYDIGIGGVSLEKETEEEIKIKKLLRFTNDALWREVLKNMNVGYIFVHKTPYEKNEEFNDWFLEQSDFFEILIEDEYGRLYRIK